MNNKFLIGLVLIGSLVGGIIGAHFVAPLLGGDFAGGVLPGNLWTGSAATNSVTPITSNVLVPGTVSVSGVGANNQITALYTATVAYPTAAVLLGPIAATTSTTSTVISFNATGFAVGDACNVSYNGSTSTLPFGADGFVTAVATSTNAVSATVTFWNGAPATSIGFNVTSSATGASSTLKATCFHTGV